MSPCSLALVQNNLKNLDPSYKMFLDFGVVKGEKPLHLIIEKKMANIQTSKLFQLPRRLLPRGYTLPPLKDSAGKNLASKVFFENKFFYPL